MKESSENYLESILILTKEKSSVRSIDIVNMLDFSKPSVSVAMKKLKEKALISIDKDGFITLSELGQKMAENILERHEVLTKTFLLLGISEETAKADACKVEHYISDETFQALKKYIADK